uniref:Uncharacterized protein n=1 Tax=Hucho hucho TaxID=62062 RepID=A0A4W5RAG3_9TELE
MGAHCPTDPPLPPEQPEVLGGNGFFKLDTFQRDVCSFEIEINGLVVFSKLETSGFPLQLLPDCSNSSQIIQHLHWQDKVFMNIKDKCYRAPKARREGAQLFSSLCENNSITKL